MYVCMFSGKASCFDVRTHKERAKSQKWKCLKSEKVKKACLPFISQLRFITLTCSVVLDYLTYSPVARCQCKAARRQSTHYFISVYFRWFFQFFFILFLLLFNLFEKFLERKVCLFSVYFCLEKFSKMVLVAWSWLAVCLLASTVPPTPLSSDILFFFY